MFTSNTFRMKVDMTHYSNIIHTIYAVILFVVIIVNLQYYSVYVFCVIALCHLSDCLYSVTIIPYISEEN